MSKFLRRKKVARVNFEVILERKVNELKEIDIFPF